MDNLTIVKMAGGEGKRMNSSIPKIINTGSTATKSKAKSWIGIGTGNHKIEIIPILDPGQSIGIDAYQVARAV